MKICIDKIAEMNKISNDFDELLSKIKEYEGKEKKEEERLEKEEKEDEDEEKYNIIIEDLNKEIDEEKIRNKIKNYYENLE